MKSFIIILISAILCIGAVKTDTIKAVVGTFTDSTSATVASTTRSRTGTAFSDSIANTGGIKSQRFWAYNSTNRGSFISLEKSIGSLPGYPSDYYPVLKTDYVNMFFAANGKYVGTIGPEYLAITDTADYGAEYKFAVIRDTSWFNTYLGIMTNTPQYPLHVVGGANAYTTYAIGSSTTGQSFGSKVQAGTNASDQAFGVYSYAGLPYFTIRGDGLPAFWLGLEVAGGANIDSLKINGGDYLRGYDTCLFACSLYTEESSSGGSYLGLTGTGRAERIGNTVTLSFPTFAETSLSALTDAATVQCVLPSGFCPVDATTSYRCDFATWSSGATNTLKIAPARSKFNNSTGATAIRITGATESAGQRLVVGYSTSTSQDGVISSQRWTINYKID